MNDNIYLIGDISECEKYIDSIENSNLLPLENLPVVYFPFKYNIKNSNDDNLKYFSNIIEKDDWVLENTEDESYKCDNNNINSVKCSNIRKLFSSITNMESEWQPYNNNNIKLILGIIIILWIIIFLIILKILKYYLDTNYSIFIILSTSIVLLIAIIYGLFISVKR